MNKFRILLFCLLIPGAALSLLSCGTMPLPVDTVASKRLLKKTNSSQAAYTDVGKEREHDCMDAGGRPCQEQVVDGRGSFAYTDVGKEREHDCMDAGGRPCQEQVVDGRGSFAYTDVGKEREHGRGSFAKKKESKTEIATVAALPNSKRGLEKSPENTDESSVSVDNLDKTIEETADKTYAGGFIAAASPTTGNELGAPSIIASDRSIERHVTRAIEKLKSGKVYRARLELTTALDKKPGYANAVLLLEQIEQSAEDYLEQKVYFNYVLKPGETLMSVSKKYLGNPLKFYALAKLNNIEVPNKVTPGRAIKIPGKKPKIRTKAKSTIVFKTRPVMKSVAANENLSDKIAEARNLLDEGKYLSSIDVLSDIKINSQVPVSVIKLLDEAYIKYTDELVVRSSLLEAQALLESAASSLPRSKKIKKQLRFVKQRREAERLFKIGLSELTAGNRTEAFEVFSKTLKLNPRHMLAEKQLTALKTDVVGLYHKRAMQHYVKQELDDAIKIWNDVLNIEPGHAMARVYLEKAKNLQKRFKQL